MVDRADLRLISIIIPVYNVETYLDRCIKSLIHQTYPFWKAILIDDGSTDASPLICDKFAQRDSRICVIHQKHVGIGHTRNVGIRHITGSFVAFLDSDDYMEPQMLEFLYTWLLESGADIAACGYYFKRGNSINSPAKPLSSSIFQSEESLVRAMQRDYYQGFLWNKLFRRTLFHDEDGPHWFAEDISICEDLLFLISCLQDGARIIYRNDPLYFYCVRSTSLTETVDTLRLSELEARKRIVKLVNTSGERVTTLAWCKYAETAANLLCHTEILKNRPMARYFHAEAKKYTGSYYRNSDLRLWEKVRFFLKINFPLFTTKVLFIKLRLRQLQTGLFSQGR